MAKKSLLYVSLPVGLIQYALQGELVVVLWRYLKGFRCETLQGTEPISTLVRELCIELTSHLVRIGRGRQMRGGWVRKAVLSSSSCRLGPSGDGT